MKKLVIMLTALFFMGALYAQGKTDDKKSARKEKRRVEMEEQSRITKAMLENKDFVLETDYLMGRYGDRIPVSSNINFIKVDSTTAVIQIGSYRGLGYNGVGGITAKGRITKWELKENPKKDTYNLLMGVMTPIGYYDLQISIGGSGYASARMTGTTPGNLTFDGKLVPNQLSRVYEGTSL